MSWSRRAWRAHCSCCRVRLRSASRSSEAWPGGLCGFHLSSRHDPKGVPADVAVWATCGLVALGLIGLLVTPRGPARFLRRAAAGVILIAPFATASLAAVLVQACPLYVTDHAGFCFHEIDVLGGWITQVVFLFILDAAALAVLLLVSAKEVDSK